MKPGFLFPPRSDGYIMMIPASRNALADWSFSGGPCSQAVSPMLLLKPPKSQMSSKLVSQIASKLNKPAAFTEIAPGQEIRFLHPLPNFCTESEIDLRSAA